MSTRQKAEGLREQKKRLTRQQLSNTATELFIKQGFDNVTVSDIAAAAKVSKMTVFNYFPRKEELYFDRIDEIHQTRELIEQEHPLIRIDRRVADFWQGVAASPALRVYALEQFAELTQALSNMLAARLSAPEHNPVAALIASIILNSWRIAFSDALRQPEHLAPAVRQRFLTLLENGFRAAEAAAQDTPYA
jgi:AcrR family transcriptional regulator